MAAAVISSDIYQPKTVTEIEYCDKNYRDNCYYEQTGIFYSKVVDMQ